MYVEADRHIQFKLAEDFFNDGNSDLALTLIDEVRDASLENKDIPTASLASIAQARIYRNLSQQPENPARYEDYIREETAAIESVRFATQSSNFEIAQFALNELAQTQTTHGQSARGVLTLFRGYEHLAELHREHDSEKANLYSQQAKVVIANIKPNELFENAKLERVNGLGTRAEESYTIISELLALSPLLEDVRNYLNIVSKHHRTISRIEDTEVNIRDYPGTYAELTKLLAEAKQHGMLKPQIDILRDRAGVRWKQDIKNEDPDKVRNALQEAEYDLNQAIKFAEIIISYPEQDLFHNRYPNLEIFRDDPDHAKLGITRAKRAIIPALEANYLIQTPAEKKVKLHEALNIIALAETDFTPDDSFFFASRVNLHAYQILTALSTLTADKDIELALMYNDFAVQAIRDAYGIIRDYTKAGTYTKEKTLYKNTLASAEERQKELLNELKKRQE